MKRITAALLALAGTGVVGAQDKPEPCPTPSVSFQWVGPHALFLTTNAKFAAKFVRSDDPMAGPEVVDAAIPNEGGARRNGTASASPGKETAKKATASTDTILAGEPGVSETPPRVVPAVHEENPPAERVVADERWDQQPPRLVVLGVTRKEGAGVKEAPLLIVRDVAITRHVTQGSDPKEETQTFRVNIEDASLLENGGRVRVAFIGLADCHQPSKALSPLLLENVVALEPHHMSVDLGFAYSFDATGAAKVNPELALNAYSRWFASLSGDVDVRFTKVDAVETQPSSAEGADASAPKPDPFLGKGGNTVDAAARVLLNLDPRGRRFLPSEASQPPFAVVLGGGMRSRGGDMTEMRGRVFGGARLQVLGYNAGAPAASFADTRGFLEVGYGKDQFWKDAMKGHDERLYAEGQIEVPSVGNRWLRLLARLRMDRPWNQTGTSEVRLSVLGSVDLTQFKGLLGAPK